MGKGLKKFIKESDERNGTPLQAIEFALTIDDHFDMRQFLEDWQCGKVATLEDWADYREWLKENK